MISLDGQRILVTGAAGGIGRVIVERILAAGAKVVLVDLDAAGAQALAERLDPTRSRTEIFDADVSDRSSVARLEERVRRSGAPISGLVNSAGVSLGERLEDDDFFEKWELTFKVNVDGTAFMIRSFLDQLKATKGAVVNVASTCAFQAGNCPTAYAAAKAAVRLLTQSFARDVAPYGIRINAVAPALIATEMSAEQRKDADMMRNFNVRSLMKRPGKPEEVAGPIVVLLSSISSYMTGVTVPIDGGILS